MEVGDIIRHRMITEVDSVAVSNSYYYIVKDATLGSTLDTLVGDIHTEWWTLIKPNMSEDVATTCSIWENLMGNDPTFAKFQTIAGVVLAGNIPAQHAVAVTKKAIASSGRISWGTNKMSGIAETLQVGGHMTEYELALGLEQWLTVDQTYGPSVLRAVQKAKIGEVIEYNEIQTATTNGHILTVPSREPVLCRASVL